MKKYQISLLINDEIHANENNSSILIWNEDVLFYNIQFSSVFELKHFILLFRPFIFQALLSNNQSLFFNPQTYCRRIFGIVHLDFREKLDKKWWGICRVLRPVCEFKKIKELVTKKLFGNRFRVSRSKIDFCVSDFKNKWP